MYNANTTDDQQELFVLVDEHDEVIGTVLRKDAHSNPKLIHRSVGVLVFNAKKQLLFQKRSKTKDTFPGYWGISVGGHVNVGQTYEEAAKREMEEELGKVLEIVEVKKHLMREKGETEWGMLFAAVDDGPFPNFNQTEADAVDFFDMQEVLEKRTLQLTPAAKKSLELARDFIDSGKLDQLIAQKEQQ